MRIIGGNLKGRRFSVSKKFPSRPTTDYAKEGLFNLLSNQLDLDDLKILDLCSGTGNIAFEFISRGASFVTCVDINHHCLRFIQESAKTLKIDDSIKINKSDIYLFLKKNKLDYDLIFADPPYSYNFYEELIKQITEVDSFINNGIFVLEHSKDRDFSSFDCFKVMRNYGNVSFSFFYKNE